MRCPIQSSLIARAKDLMIVPKWNGDAHFNTDVCLESLNTELVADHAEGGWRSAPLPALWVLDYIFDGDRSYGLENLCGEWNDFFHDGNASDEELEMMEEMLEDWHLNLSRWMCDWQEYEESVMEEDWGKTWYLEDFAVGNN